MNEKIKELALQAGGSHYPDVGGKTLEQFAELMIAEFVGILEEEIVIEHGRRATACNEFDVRWHEGKIAHFTKLVTKSKQHFGVEE